MPLALLQGRQTATRLAGVVAPPRARGSTWSTSVASLPQYLQVHPSRSRTAPRSIGWMRRWAGSAAAGSQCRSGLEAEGIGIEKLDRPAAIQRVPKPRPEAGVAVTMEAPRFELGSADAVRGCLQV